MFDHMLVYCQVQSLVVVCTACVFRMWMGMVVCGSSEYPFNARKTVAVMVRR